MQKYTFLSKYICFHILYFAFPVLKYVILIKSKCLQCKIRELLWHRKHPLYIIHYTLYIVHCSLYIINYQLSIILTNCLPCFANLKQQTACSKIRKIWRNSQFLNNQPLSYNLLTTPISSPAIAYRMTSRQSPKRMPIKSLSCGLEAFNAWWSNAKRIVAHILMLFSQIKNGQNMAHFFLFTTKTCTR